MHLLINQFFNFFYRKVKKLKNNGLGNPSKQVNITYQLVFRNLCPTNGLLQNPD